MSAAEAMPARLQRRPQYRGFPIPFTTLIDDKGVPHFKVTDIAAWHICVDERKCSLCAEPLDYWVYYIGSQGHVEREMFFDMAMHRDCAEYAAKICPYINHGKAYGYTIEPIPGVTVHELVPREDLSDEGVPLFLARGRRNNIKRVLGARQCFVRSGTLLEAIPVGHAARAAGLTTK